jgi:hypothetical protein
MVIGWEDKTSPTSLWPEGSIMKFILIELHSWEWSNTDSNGMAIQCIQKLSNGQPI